MFQTPADPKEQPWKAVWPPKSSKKDGEKYGREAGEMLYIDGTVIKKAMAGNDEVPDPIKDGLGATNEINKRAVSSDEAKATEREKDGHDGTGLVKGGNQEVPKIFKAKL